MGAYEYMRHWLERVKEGRPWAFSIYNKKNNLYAPELS